MIQDTEFWQEVGRTAPLGPLTVHMLAAALHRSMRGCPQGNKGGYVNKSGAVATAHILPSPTSRSPTSTVTAMTPMASARLNESARALTPLSTLNEPFLGSDGSPMAFGSPSSTHKQGRASTPTPNKSQGSAICRSNSTKPKHQGPFTIGSLPICESVVTLLQHTMMYCAPLYTWRYRIPAMSMSFNSSCVVDAATQRLVTFGVNTASVPVELRCRGCVAGDTFTAVVTDRNEVWVSGSLDSGNGSIAPTSDNMRGVCTRSLMISGNGSRLLVLTSAFTVRPLSIIPINTRSVLPSRLIRFLDVGIGDDCYMVGVDSIIYKTTVSQRAVSTPRRVMTLARLAIARVASGVGFQLFIDEGGQVYSVGKNKRGQLGNGLKQDSMRRPYRIARLAHHYMVQVAAGEFHSLALSSSGVAYGSGSNEYGQLGLGSTVSDVAIMTRVPLDGKCVGIAAGPLGSMFAMEDGRIMVCGFNETRQLGLGAHYDQQKMVCVPTCIPRAIVSGGAYLDVLDVAAALTTQRNGVGFAGGSASVTSPFDGMPGTQSGLQRTTTFQSSVGTPLSAQRPKTTSMCKKCCDMM